MTNLATYTQIANLVKSWSEKVASIQPADDLSSRDLVQHLSQEMRAFGNGLQVAVETFGPLIAELDHVVAAHNVVVGNEDGATIPVPVTEAEYRSIPDRQCKQRRLHGAHYWRDLTMYACPGNKPMVPEEV